MKENKFNAKFREYAKTLSPQPDEQKLIGEIYTSFNKLLGINNCIQIGSYPRYTAVTKVKDLDILYFLGNWDEHTHDPSTALQSVYTKIQNDYENPTDYVIKIQLQTHSVTVAFLDNNEEIFSVDVVPAYVFSKNNFNEDTYKVPEVIIKKHGKNRVEYYKKLSQEHKEMKWITSDPRGYTKIASCTDKDSSGEFRKSVKLIKKWKNSLINKDQELKLKSFHLEQVIINFFKENKDLKIFDVVFKFFTSLPDIIGKPHQINDRANSDKFIDDYLENFRTEQKEKIIQARDWFLTRLETFSENDSVQNLFDVDFYKRYGNEKFLFDFPHPISIFTEENLSFEIDGLLKRKDGFREYRYSISSFDGRTDKNNSIKFRIVKELPDADKCKYKWKVKNDNDCLESRGDITDNNTRNDPENTAYIGNHYVECYAILENICVAKAKQNVTIE